jgi:hypothetical protein
MNCKPGDLAVVVREMPLSPGMLGRIVRVVRRATDFERLSGFRVTTEGIPGWVVEAPRMNWEGDVVDSRAISDHLLRPIRDPGDSAVDEMLLLVGSPTKETA